MDDIKHFMREYDRLQWSDKAKQMLTTTFVGKCRDWLQICIQKKNCGQLNYPDFKKAIIEAFTRINAKVDGV